jgi:hypothetical protein
MKMLRFQDWVGCLGWLDGWRIFRRSAVVGCTQATCGPHVINSCVYLGIIVPFAPGMIWFSQFPYLRVLRRSQNERMDARAIRVADDTIEDGDR